MFGRIGRFFQGLRRRGNRAPAMLPAREPQGSSQGAAGSELAQRVLRRVRPVSAGRRTIHRARSISVSDTRPLVLAQRPRVRSDVTSSDLPLAVRRSGPPVERRPLPGAPEATPVSLPGDSTGDRSWDALWELRGSRHETPPVPGEPSQPEALGLDDVPPEAPPGAAQAPPTRGAQLAPGRSRVPPSAPVRSAQRAAETARGPGEPPPAHEPRAPAAPQPLAPTVDEPIEVPSPAPGVGEPATDEVPKRDVPAPSPPVGREAGQPPHPETVQRSETPLSSPAGPVPDASTVAERDLFPKEKAEETPARPRAAEQTAPREAPASVQRDAGPMSALELVGQAQPPVGEEPSALESLPEPEHPKPTVPPARAQVGPSGMKRSVRQPVPRLFDGLRRLLRRRQRDAQPPSPPVPAMAEGDTPLSLPLPEDEWGGIETVPPAGPPSEPSVAMDGMQRGEYAPAEPEPAAAPLPPQTEVIEPGQAVPESTTRGPPPALYASHAPVQRAVTEPEEGFRDTASTAAAASDAREPAVPPSADAHGAPIAQPHPPGAAAAGDAQRPASPAPGETSQPVSVRTALQAAMEQPAADRREMLREALQPRVVPATVQAAPADGGTGSAAEQQAPDTPQAEGEERGPDVEALARDVYRILRRRLLVERERQAGRL